MHGKMITIQTNGNVTTREYDSEMRYEELQAEVGGYIESVPFFRTFDGHPCVAFCNEEGKIHGLEPNHAASTFWYEAAPRMRGQDALVGPVVIVWGDKEFMEAL